MDRLNIIIIIIICIIYMYIELELPVINYRSLRFPLCYFPIHPFKSSSITDSGDNLEPFLSLMQPYQ